MKGTGGAGQLLDELAELIRSAQTLLETTGAGGAHRRDHEHGPGAVEGGLDAAAERLRTAQEELLEHARNAWTGTERYLRKHPAQAWGLAAALGFLAGIALARRRGPD
jgi:ElaB/YqjD/DUF883 family membrane-anchored ribosome-binding protein